MGQCTPRSLEDIWPLQAELNRRAGFDTLALGQALEAAACAAGDGADQGSQTDRGAARAARGVGRVPGVSQAAGKGGAAGQDAPLADQAARLAAGRALKNYLDALSSECHELQDCLSWKHWYQEARQGRQHELRDLQNARVEAVDMLFFWVSICQLLGLSPADVYRLYAAKLGINHRRQDEDRTQAQHGRHEHENRGVV